MASSLIEEIDEWDMIRSTWSAPKNKLELIKYAHPLSNCYDESMQHEIYKRSVVLKKHTLLLVLLYILFAGHTFSGY